MAALAQQTASEPQSVLEHAVAAIDIPLARAATVGEVAQLITFLTSLGGYLAT